MKYVWIWILVGIDAVWLASSIMDVKHTIKYVEENEQYNSTADFISCVIKYLENSTIGFIVLHLAVLFFVSFIAWVNFKIGGAE